MPEPAVALQGRVMGGQAPIVGAHVYLLQPNSAVYGGPGIAPSSGNAAVSLISSTGPGTSLDSSGGATNGFYYVTSDGNGNWTITGDYSCISNEPVFLYALGGNAGSGTNSAAGLLATLGQCPSSGTFSSSLFITMNEVSTIATAYAIAGFASDATHVSTSGSRLAQFGLLTASQNVANLETLSTGVALATTPGGGSTVPQTEINTLANILASCVNSAGPGSAACTTLLADAKSGGSSGTAPTDTATAAINIAHNPTANIAALYALSTGTPPFAPALTSAPNDFTVAISFTAGGINTPSSVAIDGSGNAWIANNITTGSVTELSPLGVALNSSPLTGGGLRTPSSLAIDINGNVWIANNYNPGSITELNGTTGAVMGSSPFTGAGVNEPYGICVDNSDNVWTANFGEGFSGSVSKFKNDGTPVSGSSGYGTGMEIANGIATDPSGNVWNTDLNFGNLDEVNTNGVLQSGFSGYNGGSSINNPTALAFDQSSRVWVATHGSNVRVLSDTGTAVGTYTGGGLGLSQAIAMDGAGNAWIANRVSSVSLPGLLSEFSNSGTALTSSTGFTTATMINPTGIAVDLSGDAWVSNAGNSTVTEFIGAAVPVTTPLAYGAQIGSLGTRP
jgi:hypothetical protein